MGTNSINMLGNNKAANNNRENNVRLFSLVFAILITPPDLPPSMPTEYGSSLRPSLMVLMILPMEGVQCLGPGRLMPEEMQE